MKVLRGTRWWLLAMLIGGLALATSCMVHMPGTSFSKPLPETTSSQKDLAAELRGHVAELATRIGERNTARPDGLARANAYVAGQLAATGLTLERQGFDVGGVRCENLIVEIPGSTLSKEIVVVGAHYDSFTACPAADDNGSGVAALLALARAFKEQPQARTLRFVAFVNEEPPHYKTDAMGSLVYARSCRERGDDVVAMLSLETMGYFVDDPDSQKYPWPFGLFYPSTGNFIGFVGNWGSRELVRRSVASFRKSTPFPSEGAALPSWVPGISWSDHWSFWQAGYPGVMVSDTAPFRYPHYHYPSDTADRVVYDRMARVVDGLRDVIRDLGSSGTQA